MENEIKVSIIVPVYNVSRYLRRCLDSCVCQTRDDIEVVIVHDCSPDPEDLVICNEYVAKYPDKVRLILHPENKGLGAARNTGIKAARGEFLTFVDSDDYIDFAACGSMHYQAELNSADYVLGDLWRASLKDCNVARIKRVNWVVEEDANRMSFYSVASLIKRELIINSNIFFLEGKKYEDIPAVPIWLALSEKTISYNGSPVYFYLNDREGAITSGSFADLFLDLIDSYSVLLSRTKEKCPQYAQTIFKAIARHINMVVAAKMRCKEDLVTLANTQLPAQIFRELISSIEWEAPNEHKDLLDFLVTIDNNTDFHSAYLYISQMYLNKFLQYYTDDQLLSEFGKRDPSTVCIWGCGIYGERLLKRFARLNLKFEVTDMDASKHGEITSTGAIIKPWGEIKTQIKTVIVAIRGQYRNMSAFLGSDVEVYAFNG